MAPFGQVLTAMITPFDGDGTVDLERFWRLARFLVDNGSDGLVVAGTTGESPTLSVDEKAALFQAAVDAVGERASIVAGTGTYDTRESIELSERAASSGVDAVMAVTPYYSKPSQGGLIEHFTAIADSTELPMILYNIPSRTSRRIEVGTLRALAEHERIVAVKDAVLDLEFTSKTIVEAPDLAVYSGQDSLTLPMMAAGAVGVVSVVSHLAGKRVKAMTTAIAEGDLANAATIHNELFHLCETCFLEPNPTPVKAALTALWEPVGDPRLPLVSASEATVTAIKEALGRVQGL